MKNIWERGGFISKFTFDGRQDVALFFANRVAHLRIEKGVSAREMSLSLGQRESYIFQIESGKMLPSMEMFFYICEYFQISPSHFFHEDEYDVALIEAVKKLQRLDKRKRQHLFEVINDMT